MEHRLKTLRREDYSPNGVALFCGQNTRDGNKMISEVVPLVSPIPKMTYDCGKRFQVKAIMESLENESTFGVIVIDGKSLTIGKVCGEKRTIVYSSSVELPKKHGRGGQSAGRFFRQRV